MFFSPQETDDETGLLDLIKSQVCDNVALYAQKYDEEFEVRVSRTFVLNTFDMVHPGFSKDFD